MTVKGLLLDVEGTLVADKRYQPIAGAAEFVAHARQTGLDLRLITNNTTDTRHAIKDKLQRAGLHFAIEEIHTCITAAVTQLREMNAATCLVLGAPALGQMFADEGFDVASRSAVDAVVVGLDMDLTYERLALACDAVGRNGAVLIALHRNRLVLDTRGRLGPSAGAIVEAITYATQVEPILIGKPSPRYYQQALDAIALPAESVLVVSDDPFTDLAGAKRIGMHAAFVLSGKYRQASVIESIPDPEKPDIVVDSIGDLLTNEALDIRSDPGD
jgi:4-nitrophenyl phosphatase